MRIDLAVNKTVAIQPELTISGATNASPIQLTFSAPHNLETGDLLLVLGVGGNLAANGQHSITLNGASTCTLDNSHGSGAYVPGSGVAFHEGFVTPPILIDSSVFPGGVPDCTLSAVVQNAPSSNWRFVFEDAADSAFLTGLPLAGKQIAAGAGDLAFSFKKTEMPDLRIGESGDYLRLRVLNSQPFSSVQFSAALLV